jgi:hypothetical protein
LSCCPSIAWLLAVAAKLLDKHDLLDQARALRRLRTVTLRFVASLGARALRRFRTVTLVARRLSSSIDLRDKRR